MDPLHLLGKLVFVDHLIRFSLLRYNVWNHVHAMLKGYLNTLKDVPRLVHKGMFMSL